MFQAILFAAFALIFLFTSAKMQLKRLVLWLFGIAVFIHAAGLSLRGRYDWVDYVLMVNGIALLLLVGYMSFKIYTRFVKKRRTSAR
ncbi:MAG: hypothetical protein KAU36_02240 [candidate division Zixibacteria bacterium]|nr:hypothetical protein [candidate division Zixibacteria bacterium]